MLYMLRVSSTVISLCVLISCHVKYRKAVTVVSGHVYVISAFLEKEIHADDRNILHVFQYLFTRTAFKWFKNVRLESNYIIVDCSKRFFLEVGVFLSSSG